MSNPYASPPPPEPEKDSPPTPPVPPSDAPREPDAQTPPSQTGSWQSPPDASGRQGQPATEQPYGVQPPPWPQPPYTPQPYGPPFGQQPGYSVPQPPDGQAAWSAHQPYGQPDPYGQQGQPQWGGQPPVYATGPAPGQGYGYSLVDRLRSNSTWVLVLGILGIIQVLGLLGAIPAWVWGNSLIRQARQAGLPDDVVQNAKVGRILGIIEVALAVAATVIIVLFMIFGAFAANRNY